MPNITIPSMNREVFETLVKSIYVDPQRASLREILANAVDSNRSNAKNGVIEPVVITFNHDTISIADKGTGISPEIMDTVYGAMFQSTKRSRDKSVITKDNGEHGIGSKAPYGLLYALHCDYGRNTGNYYTVDTVSDGVRYVYLMFLNEEVVPSYEVIHQAETDAPNGTTVSFPNFIKLNRDFVLSSNHSELLREVLLPFMDGQHTTVPLEFNGDNCFVLDEVKTIQSVAESVLVHRNIRVYDAPSSRRSVLVKYKNVFYPVSIDAIRTIVNGPSLTKSLQEDSAWFKNDYFEIIDRFYFDEENLASLGNWNQSGSKTIVVEATEILLDKPLPTNRSRDRFELDKDACKQLLNVFTEVAKAHIEIIHSTETICQHIVRESSITNVIIKNKLVNDAMEPFNLLGFMQDNGYGGENLFEALCEYFKTDPSVPFNKFLELNTEIRNFDILGKGFYPVKTNVSIGEDSYVNCDLVNNIREAVKRQDRSVLECTRAGQGVPTSYAPKEKTLLNDKILFVIRNKGAYKVPVQAVLDDQGNQYEKVFLIKDDNIDIGDFEKFGIKNATTLDVLIEKYAASVARSKTTKRTSGTSRIKGISRINKVGEATDFSYKDENRKTVNSSDIDHLLNNVDPEHVFYVPASFDDVYGYTLDDMEFSIRQDSLDKNRYHLSVGGVSTAVKSFNLNSLFPKGSVVFYLDGKTVPDHIKEEASNGLEFIRNKFSERSFNVVHSDVSVESIHGAMEKVLNKEACGDEAEAIGHAKNLLTQMCRRGYFPHQKNTTGGKVCRFESILTRLETHTLEDGSLQFVNAVYDAIRSDEVISTIINCYNYRYGIDDELHNKYHDLILKQMGIEKP